MDIEETGEASKRGVQADLTDFSIEKHGVDTPTLKVLIY